MSRLRYVISTDLWGKHFEDLKVGEKFSTEGRTVTEADIVLFSGLVGDFYFMHTDEERSKNSMFKTRILQGLLTFAISEGLVMRGGLFDSMKEAQYVSIQDLKFTGAVKPGDTIKVDFEITDKKDSDEPGYGLIALKRTVTNQKGETVIVAETSYLKKKARSS